MIGAPSAADGSVAAPAKAPEPVSKPTQPVAPPPAAQVPPAASRPRRPSPGARRFGPGCRGAGAGGARGERVRGDAVPETQERAEGDASLCSLERCLPKEEAGGGSPCHR